MIEVAALVAFAGVLVLAAVVSALYSILQATKEDLAELRWAMQDEHDHLDLRSPAELREDRGDRDDRAELRAIMNDPNP